MPISIVGTSQVVSRFQFAATYCRSFQLVAILLIKGDKKAIA